MTIARNLPLVILPCSADKLSYPAKAMNLYRGKGYLPVLKNKPNIYLGRDYHLAFMSAKHGLIMHDEIIAPYEQTISKAQSNWLVDNLSHNAVDIVTALAPSKVIACLPKLYLSTFEHMMASSDVKFNLAKPGAGAGIGLQRQFLSNELDKLIQNVATFFLFYDMESKKALTRTTHVEVRVGDIFTPYFGGVGEDKCIGGTVSVKAITTKSGVHTIIDEYNRAYTSHCISRGLSQGLRDAAEKYSGLYELGMNLDEISVSLSALNEHVLQVEREGTFKLSA